MVRQNSERRFADLQRCNEQAGPVKSENASSGGGDRLDEISGAGGNRCGVGPRCGDDSQISR